MKFFRELVKSTALKVFLAVSLLFGTVAGCNLSSDQNTGEVGVTIAHVQQFAQTAEALAAVATVTYLHEDAAAVKVVLDKVVDVVGGANGNVANLILATVDESITAGQLNASYRLFFVGLLAVINDYLHFNDYNVDDVLTILKAASNGLGVQTEGGAAVQSAPGFDW